MNPTTHRPRAHRRRALLALATACSVVLGACGGDDDTADSTTPGVASSGSTASSTGSATAVTSTGASTAGTNAPSSAPTKRHCDATVKGTKLNLGVFLSTGKLDPTLVAGGVVGGTETAALYDTLFTYDYSTRTTVPHLAAGIEHSADFTTWTLKLRPGITYSDGRPLDAQMVINNLDRWAAQGTTATQGGLIKDFVGSTKIIDPTTLEITMSKPWAEFDAFLTEQVGMIVNTKVAGDDREAFAANPPDAAGVGPYVIQRNAPGEEIVFTARKDYWGGPVCIETLRVVAIPGSQATYESFQNNELDVAYLSDPAVIKSAKADGFDGEFHGADIGLEFLLNLREGNVGHDPRLREALWRAIDADRLNQQIYAGTLNVSPSLINPHSPWAGPGLETVPFDLERAKQLVAEAKADGVDTSITYLTNTDQPYADIAVAVQAMLQSAGFEVTVVNAARGTKIPTVLKGEFELTNWALSIEPAEITTRLYGALHSTAVNNRGHYQSPEMDAALLAALSADVDQRAAAVTKINNIYTKDFVSPVLADAITGIIWHDKVHGVITNPTVIYLFHDAYLD